MKVLAIDIGAGTSDILVYNDQKQSIENCVKMVLPSPSLVYANRVHKATQRGLDVFLKGNIIGGGSLTSALRRHLKQGLKVLMTKNAAYTVRNLLEQVTDLGIEIVPENSDFSDIDVVTIFLNEIPFKEIHDFVSTFDETLLDVDVVAIAVQDHGVFPKEISNRQFRIHKIHEILTQNPLPESLAFLEDAIPHYFLRMRAATKASRLQLPNAKVLVMDTAPAAVLGCLQDSAVRSRDPVLAVNVGNGHTMAAIISGGQVIGVMEHHTRALTPQKIELLLTQFGDGQLSNDDVFQDGGHGAFYLSTAPGFSHIQTVAATGPNRRLLANTKFPVYFAAPAGDVMMTGPIGLIHAVKQRITLTN